MPAAPGLKVSLRSLEERGHYWVNRPDPEETEFDAR
jgi:hypothetical protein